MSTQFTCPVCRLPLHEEGKSLQCESRHTFDIARQGYVNLLLRRPDTLYEDKALFAARRAVYEAGFFDGVVDVLRALVPQGRLLDAGCGEGSLLARLAGNGVTGIGLDIARPAVQLAAGTYKGCDWCVGDLCAIPLADASVNAVVNMLTPANYAEFDRVLTPGGLLLKVAPTAGHLEEIRRCTGAAAYTNDLADTMGLMEKRFTLLESRHIRYTVTCDEALAAQVFAMTPLTRHKQMPGVLPGQVTVDVEVLVAGKSG